MRRPLPWRATRDPYAILVSEVMLQQTQAARVVPTTSAGWSASPMRRRSRRPGARRPGRLERPRLQPPRARAAGGGPGGGRSTAGRRERLTELPGVGPYTAAALASFAWDAPVAAVDTNARRVIERRDGRRRTARELAAAGGASCCPHERARAFNQAMMELGATVCRPRRPALRRVPGAQRLRVAGAPRTSRAGGGRRVRFEDTDRWARGRVSRRSWRGEPPPALEAARRERALAGLERDGLIVRGADGEPRLP